MKVLIEALRMKDEDVFEVILKMLKKYSICLIYKYFSCLKTYGYTYDYIINYRLEFSYDYVTKFEYPVENFFPYYQGYLKHRFAGILTSYSRSKRDSSGNLSIDEERDNTFGATYNLYDVLACEENIVRWYNKEELVKQCIYSQTSDVINYAEKLVLRHRIEGLTFMEIKQAIGLSYKEVVAIYQTAIKKLKKHFI